MASGQANRSADSFGTNNNYGSGNVASNQNNGPIGQITPFTGDNGQGDDQSGWQSAAPPTRFYSGGSYSGPGYMPGYMPVVILALFDLGFGGTEEEWEQQPWPAWQAWLLAQCLV